MALLNWILLFFSNLLKANDFKKNGYLMLFKFKIFSLVDYFMTIVFILNLEKMHLVIMIEGIESNCNNHYISRLFFSLNNDNNTWRLSFYCYISLHFSEYTKYMLMPEFLVWWNFRVHIFVSVYIHLWHSLLILLEAKSILYQHAHIWLM